MTAINLLIVFALTWFSVNLIWWLLSPKEERRPLVTLVLLVVFFLWVIGVTVIVERRGG